MRKYLECDTYVSLSVQTTETLEDYEKTIRQFGARLSVSIVNVRIKMCPDNAYKAYSASTDQDASSKTDKDWDGIIKVHTHLHAARDVRLKGVLSNMDTKTSERLHGPLRKAYQLQTNFKNIEGQVSKVGCISTCVQYLIMIQTACPPRRHLYGSLRYTGDSRCSRRIPSRAGECREESEITKGEPYTIQSRIPRLSSQAGQYCVSHSSTQHGRSFL